MLDLKIKTAERSAEGKTRPRWSHDFISFFIFFSENIKSCSVNNGSKSRFLFDWSFPWNLWNAFWKVVKGPEDNDELHNHFTGQWGRCVPFVPAIYIRQNLHSSVWRNGIQNQLGCNAWCRNRASHHQHVTHTEAIYWFASVTTMIHVSPVYIRYVLVLKWAHLPVHTRK